MTFQKTCITLKLPNTLYQTPKQIAKVTLLLYQYLTTRATFLTISLVCVYFRFLLTSIVVVDLLSEMAEPTLDPPSWDAVFAGAATLKSGLIVVDVFFSFKNVQFLDRFHKLKPRWTPEIRQSLLQLFIFIIKSDFDFPPQQSHVNEFIRNVDKKMEARMKRTAESIYKQAKKIHNELKARQFSFLPVINPDTNEVVIKLEFDIFLGDKGGYRATLGDEVLEKKL